MHWYFAYSTVGPEKSWLHGCNLQGGPPKGRAGGNSPQGPQNSLDGPAYREVSYFPASFGEGLVILQKVYRDN